MSAHKWMDRLCIAAMLLSLLITIVFMNGAALGIPAAAKTMGYEDRLFDDSRVHTIDIVMEDWDAFLATCENEEYSLCTVVIDGEAFSGVGIRGKGNTSLTHVASMDSDRYSFKVEFDQYDSAKSYYGLDKLSLNNLIQDNTLMKDYLVYRMMGQMGVASPLCSFVYITVNGEDWGLYLAVEAIEESFLLRNYGSGYGALYKPDSMNIGGGRGNGKDFRIADWQNGESETKPSSEVPGAQGIPPGSGAEMAPPDESGSAGMTGKRPGTGENPGIMDIAPGNMGGEKNQSSADVMLQYIDENPSSYANIFDNAKTAITSEEETRLVDALRRLSAGEELDSTVDIESVIAYFAVHNFVCNDDSYTGTMIHNYYLYEEDGILSMLPWDYNLSFGGFQSMDANSVVNDSIRMALSDRPMVNWIFDGGEYEQMYHTACNRLLECYFSDGRMEQWISETARLITPYVQKDPTKFCTFEAFETGVSTLQTFMKLRSESVRLQLAGEEAAVDAGGLNLADMGSMGNEMGQPGEGFRQAQTPPELPQDGTGFQPPEDMPLPGGTQAPDGMQMPEGMQMPGEMQAPGGIQIPEDMQVPEGMQMPGGMQRPGSMNSEMPDMGGQFPSGPVTLPQSQSPLLLTGISILILLAGLVIAIKFKR